MTFEGVAAIVVAGGSGSRFGGDVPKQFAGLAGKPLIAHSIERFLDAGVTGVVVCVPARSLDRVRGIAAENGWSGVRVVEGGETRQSSVWNGVLESERIEAKYVAVHDAVRPLFSFGMLARVLAAARQTGGAVPVVPVTDTIHDVREGIVAATGDRGRWSAAQTPQCFRVDVLKESMVKAREDGFIGTDEAALVARYGHEVTAVAGERWNLKITYPEDLVVAEALIRMEMQ